MDTPLRTCWREYRKFVTYLLGCYLFAASHNVTAATYFQLQQSGITVLVEGDKDTTKHVLQTTLRLQSAARWLLSWPDSYREPPVLVIDVSERTIRRAFKYSSKSTGSFTKETTGSETWVRTPSLVIVTVPMGYQRGHELRSLQHAYGEALLQGEPSHVWPACVQVGMSILFAAAELTAPNHFYLSREKILGSYDVWDPVRFLVPTDSSHDERMPQWELDQGGILMLYAEFYDCVSDLRTAHCFCEDVDFGWQRDAFGRCDCDRATANAAGIHSPLPRLLAPRYPSRFSGRNPTDA
jgi:hypothetical protein